MANCSLKAQVIANAKSLQKLARSVNSLSSLVTTCLIYCENVVTSQLVAGLPFHQSSPGQTLGGRAPVGHIKGACPVGSTCAATAAVQATLSVEAL